jgi:predicted CopG family antitoxin
MPKYFTSVRVSRGTREKLGDLKREDESFDDLLNRLADAADDTAPATAAEG